jgi:hypothetical protein
MSQDSEGPTSSDDTDFCMFKDFLSEPRFRIKLDEKVSAAVRAVLVETSVEKFPLNTASVNGQDFFARLTAYEAAVKSLQMKAALLGKWVTPEQMPTLSGMLARMADHPDPPSGQSLWIGLRLYPLSLLLYSVGIASLASENFGAFAAAHSIRIDARTRRLGNRGVNIVVPVVDSMLEVASTNALRHVEEYRQKRVPESEHFFKILRPILDDLLFLGASYERQFDRYEILRMLIYADVTDGGRGPVGRFGWKYCSGGQDNPFIELRAEAAQQKDGWGPVKAGLFRGSYARFDEIASKVMSDHLNKLGWY